MPGHYDGGMRIGRVLPVAAFTIVLLSALPFRAGAQPVAANVEAEASALFHRVMSPYCDGLLLSDCQSGGAFALRDSVRARLASGESVERIEQDLYRTFGDSIRTIPLPEGFGLGVWIGPPLVLAMAGIMLLVFMARARHRALAPSMAVPEPPLSRELLARVDEELADIL